MVTIKTDKIDLKTGSQDSSNQKKNTKFMFILSKINKAQYEPRKNNILSDYGLRT